MKIFTFDTTLRDGTQGESISFSVDDKLIIAQKLDELGIDYIEGGWPGSNPKDQEFFKRATELTLHHSRLTAFGSTRFAKNPVHEDRNVRALVEAGTPVVAIFGKTWDLHVKRALGITEDQNLVLISETVRYIKDHGKEVVYDAEHFAEARGNRATVGIAQAEDIGAGVVGGLQGAQGVAGVGDVAVEEMLGVIDHFLAVVLDVAHGFGDEDEVLVLGDAEGAFDVEVPGLAEDRDDGGTGFDQGADVAVLMDRVLGEARAAERGEPGVVQGQFGSALEKLLVFGVAARPAALNIIDTQLIQLLRNDELVVHGERDGLALSAIAESGVEGRDFHKSSHWGSNLRGRRVTNPPQAASLPHKRLTLPGRRLPFSF